MTSRQQQGPASRGKGPSPASCAENFHITSAAGLAQSFGDVARLEQHCAADPLPAAKAYRQSFCGLVSTSRSQLSRAALADAQEVQAGEESAHSLYLTVMETLPDEVLEGEGHAGSAT